MISPLYRGTEVFKGVERHEKLTKEQEGGNRAGILRYNGKETENLVAMKGRKKKNRKC